MPDDLELGLLLAVRLARRAGRAERRALLAELTAALRRRRPLRRARGGGARVRRARRPRRAGAQLVQTLPARRRAGRAQGGAPAASTSRFPTLSAQAERAGEIAEPLRRMIRRRSRRRAADGAPSRSAPRSSRRCARGRRATLPDAEPRVTRLAASRIARSPLLRGARALRPHRGAAARPRRVPRLVRRRPHRVERRRDRGDRLRAVARPPHAVRRGAPHARRRSPRTTCGCCARRSPTELKRLRAEEPAEVLVARAARRSGGAADAQKLKVFLVGSGLRAGRTTGPRSGARRARGRREGPAHRPLARVRAALPALAPEARDRAPEPPTRRCPRSSRASRSRANLATLRKFLSQHPAAETALAQRFGRYVERAMLDDEGERDRPRARRALLRALVPGALAPSGSRC